jgi:PP-loop superfamily ATP-utilizing enzyme
MTFVAFSGGKDSTAMALRMAELGESFSLLFTPTGRELPGVMPHAERVATLAGRPLIIPSGPSLDDVIDSQAMLPNFRARFCTRMIKIVPCRAYLQRHPGSTLCVGLRADETDREGGLYGDLITYRRPLQEWGWGIRQVRDYVRQRGVTIPERTDCDVCFFQRLDEWWSLWRQYPERFAVGERYEAETGHTFRTPGRDSWPVPLAALRREFERGREPKAITAGRQLACFGDEEETRCRVCSL